MGLEGTIAGGECVFDVCTEDAGGGAGQLSDSFLASFAKP